MENEIMQQETLNPDLLTEEDVVIDGNTKENTDENIEEISEEEPKENTDEDVEEISEEETKDNTKSDDDESRLKSVTCDRKVGVFVKTNSEGFITAINSDLFIDNFDGWEKIDEGEGDRFVHAQTAFFDEPIIDCFGNYRYKK